MLERYNTTEKRIVAFLIDGFLLILLNPIRNNLLCYIESVSLSQLVCTFFSVLPILYFVIPVYLYGQTLGKKVMGVMIIDKSEIGSITIAQAILRNPLITLGFIFSLPLSLNIVFFDEVYPPLQLLAKFLDNVSLVWIISELVAYWSNTKKRALHDFIAGTVVVRTDYR